MACHTPFGWRTAGSCGLGLCAFLLVQCMAPVGPIPEEGQEKGSPNNARLTWSSAGPMPGQHCVRLLEPSDPHTWDDNYLCAPKDLGLSWSFAGPLPGQHCVRLNEASDPHTWDDNYLCSRQDFGFRWSSAGPVAGLDCLALTEPADPHTWNDNYLCWPRGGALANLLADGPSTNGRLVGITYATWFPFPTAWSDDGGCVWGTPELGFYDSADPAVIRQHAEWLADAGVDFILIDWSNNIDASNPARRDLHAIEEATEALFDVYAQLPRHPRIAIMIGGGGGRENYTNGRIQAKADQVYAAFINNPRYRRLYQNYRGRPLLVDYVGTPCPFSSGVVPWDDGRFTVRHMTGFLSDQPVLLSADRVSRFGFWSWEDRGAQSYPVVDGRPEFMVVSAAVRGDPCGWPCAHQRQTREGGRTFRSQWARAQSIGVDVALVQSWNEWTGCRARPGEEMNAERSNDIEPSREHGRFYLDLLTEEIARFKQSGRR